MAIQIYVKINLLRLRLAYCTKPKLLITINHYTMLNLDCDCEVRFGTHMKLELSRKKKHGRPKILALIKVWFVTKVYNDV